MLALFVVAGQLISRAHSGGPPSGTSVPETGLRTLEGTPLTRDALQGHVTVLNFWATWCPACRGELPELSRFARAQASDCVKLVGVSDEDGPTLQSFTSGHPLAYPLAPGGGELERALEVEVLPTTVVLDRDGRIAARHEGTLSAAQLEELVRPLRGAPGC